FIDKVIRKEDEAYIIGWAFKRGCKKVEISVKDVDNVKFNKVEKRVDLFNKFDQEEGSDDCGFQVVIPYSNRAILIFKADNEVEKVSLNIKSLALGIKNNKMKRALGLLNMMSIKKGIKEVQKNGVAYTFHRTKNKIMKGHEVEAGIDYNTWFLQNCATEEELDLQRKHKFEYNPKISIVVPTYNTKPEFLRVMIESVRNQTYTNWELCIADGASKSEETLKMLNEYIKIDNRIKVNFLKENYMISGNTNEGLKIITGEFVALLDHDDLLTHDALFEYVKVLNEDRDVEFMYSDEDKTDENDLEFFGPHFKQDWAPDTLRSYNYITHFSVFSKALLDKVGYFNSKFDGSQDYDMILRLTEKAKKVIHIPKVLYHWRVHSESTAAGIDAKPYALIAAENALRAHLERIGESGIVKPGKFSGSYKVDFDIIGEPKVSIIIPNKDEVNTLKTCINSIVNKTEYKNYEIVIVENNSEKKSTFKYYDELSKNKNIKIVKWEEKFNYSAINNFGVKHATGEYILLLNNDVEIITEKWINEMLMHAQRKSVGAVGAKLYYPDNSVQHCGVILGVGGIADHLGKESDRYDVGHIGRLMITQNLSAVTAACMMMRKAVYEEVSGLSEEFEVAYNDIDLCMKIREKGYLIVLNPFAELYHYESKSRGQEDTSEKVERFVKEVELFKSKWGNKLLDPYYNVNFSKESARFKLARK
ncbi:MAG: glycosyltransferase family 2 protein, partial [Clostridium sp.]